MNSAVFFVLTGKGHDVHDGERLDWEAGDAMIVENCCVHQHFSDDPDKETIVLIMKAKPLFLFMHLIFQKWSNIRRRSRRPGKRTTFRRVRFKGRPAAADGGQRQRKI